jgi:hypothetical protein
MLYWFLKYPIKSKLVHFAVLGSLERPVSQPLISRMITSFAMRDRDPLPETDTPDFDSDIAQYARFKVVVLRIAVDPKNASANNCLLAFLDARMIAPRA